MQTILENEIPRLLQLAELNLDYVSLKEEFNGLAELAARITGTPISHINLMDALHQWTIGDFGFPSTITPREETVCQYTILNNAHLDVKDLKEAPSVVSQDWLRSFWNKKKIWIWQSIYPT